MEFPFDQETDERSGLEEFQQWIDYDSGQQI